MRRKSLEDSVCAVARSLDLIGDWWTLLIVREALSGAKRFGEFQKNLGMAKNILSVRLRSMVDNGIMEMVTPEGGQAYYEYVLTEQGKALTPVLVALAQWGGDYLFDAKEKSSLLLDAKKRRPLRPLELRSQDGKLLGVDDIFVPPTPSGAA
ncbi:MAG TPA: helix-turn-helix domain-containing protein [Luteibacter sp.]|nr:helix-turn-helix domain-containing protein [Luteibacter sp.]